jgi:NAD(P)-dependent dehydrogenase (short-subunit alcohol dehydrogenase family)
MTLSGKVAVVTGATSEIGQAVALRLAAEGATVAAIGQTPEKVKKLLSALKAAGPQHRAHALDLSQPDVVERFFRTAARSLGPVDVLVNAAAWRARQSFLDITPTDWRKTFAVSLDSYFYCSQAAARQMISRKWGRIIHTGSIAAMILMEPFSAYTVVKGAVHALATAMAVDLAPHGISVNVVAPGVVETEFVRANLSPTQIQKRVDRIPVGRLATPEDCAAAVAHLCSPDMEYVTGQTLYVDGGFLRAGVLGR